LFYYLESPSTDPHFNLALEQHVFDNMDRKHHYCMLWQNDNAIIIGKHQNTVEEVNAAYVKEHGIHVVRRMSGGGAVYHDLGNLNFTFIVDALEEKIDFGAFCRPVILALGSMGITAELSGRNDMVIDGKKFSGNAQYRKKDRVLHHGTLLFDSNLETVSHALQVSEDKIESKGLKSVRSRITNIRPYLPQDLPLERFKSALRDFLFQENKMQAYQLTDQDLEAANLLKERVYDRWEWNYGASPPYKMHKARRFEGCGKVEVYLDVSGGNILDAKFHGDFFSSSDPALLADQLNGLPMEESALRAALSETNISHYIHGLNPDDFFSLLLQ